MVNKKEIIEMLSLSGDDVAELYQKAYRIKVENVGKKVYFRGIIEVSNSCVKNCYYCGIRRDNENLTRYEMTDEEIIESALWAYNNHYGSVVLQSGERSDKHFVDKITRLLQSLKNETKGRLGVTLSLGEQSRDTYQEWFNAGAHRYLLRIETSSKELYKRLHPEEHSYDERLKCLRIMREIGYQVGTGVMIGLPEQTIEHLADDVIFFCDMDVDMIGMGPFVLHQDTPLIAQADLINSQDNLQLALKMIAVCRIVLRDVNIAATTALQALDPQGREMGLQAGANIIMPVITDTKYRTLYQLYNGKPCLDENADQCRFCLERRIQSIGEEIGYDQWGDSPHFTKQTKD